MFKCTYISAWKAAYLSTISTTAELSLSEIREFWDLRISGMIKCIALHFQHSIPLFSTQPITTNSASAACRLRFRSILSEPLVIPQAILCSLRAVHCQFAGTSLIVKIRKWCAIILNNLEADVWRPLDNFESCKLWDSYSTPMSVSSTGEVLPVLCWGLKVTSYFCPTPSRHNNKVWCCNI